MAPSPDKNSLPAASPFSKAWVAVWLSFFMVAGFLGARALLSVATLLWGVNALRGVPPRRWFANRWWLLGTLWVALYALSFVRSPDLGEWGERVQVKLPFLLLPLAAPFFPALARRQWSVLTAGLCLLFLSGVGWSLWWFAKDPQGIIAGYNVSHTLRTPVYNDHICFSAALASVLVWSAAAWPRLTVGARWTAAACCTVFVAYLHLLAAKTGLVMLYLFVALWALRAVLQGYWNVAIAGAVGAVLLAVAAYQWSPTFRSRIGYLRYSMSEYRAGNRTGNYSDPGRLYSYDIALRLIGERPLQGWGAGNLLPTMKDGYDRWYPHVEDRDRLVPHNQFLSTGVAVGVPGMLLLFGWWILAAWALPPSRERGFVRIGWAVLSVPLFVNPAFEIQFGIAVYLFFLLWLRALALRPEAGIPFQTGPVSA